MRKAAAEIKGEIICWTRARLTKNQKPKKGQDKQQK
jgi:hypothetical protein